MVLRSRPFKCICSDQNTFKKFSFNFSIEVSLASRRQCKVSPKKMNTAENPLYIWNIQSTWSVLWRSAERPWWRRGIVSPDPDKKQGILLPILYVHNLYVLPCSGKDRANACSCDTGFPSYHNFVSVLAGCPARNHFDTHVAFFANQL